MRCPFCGHGETKVIDKRVSEEKVNRRRRECLKCKKRFTTYEKVENLITKIKKRDGRTVNFSQKKITEAIWKAAQAVGGSDREIAESLSDKVVETLEEKFGGVTVPTVEQVQDIVEKTLVENGHYKTAKAYILYREKHKKIRETRDTFVEVDETIKSYLDRLDWRVKENSNEQYSFSGLLLYAAGRVMSNYNLNEIHTPAVSEAHRKGYIHIHDLSHGVIGYCCGHSLKNLLLRGFGGVPNKVDCKPAKHLSTVVHQMVNYIGCLQMEFAGAQAFNSVDTLLAPFVRTDQLAYRQVKQNMQQLIFSLNIPSRWGSQFPFSNVTFDWVCPEDMREENAIVGGKPQGFTYGECQNEMDMINRAFIEVMLEGDANGRMFTFPIPTYNLTKDFNWDSDNAKLLFEMTAKYGSPYFQNYIGSGLDPSSIRAMCLHPDEEIIVKIDNNIQKMKISELCEKYNHGFDKEGWSENKHDIKAMSLNRDTGKLEWSDISRFLKITDNKMISITTKDGKEIRISTNHIVPILTPNGIRLKFAREISKGDYLLTTRKASTLLNKKFQKLGNHLIDIDMAKFLGIFISEGNYLYDSRKPTKDINALKGIQFSFNISEREYIREVIEIVKKKFSYELKMKKDPRYNTIQLYMYSSLLARELYNAGLRKYNTLPQVLFNSPKGIIETFLEYFFKGDGYARGMEIHIGDEPLSRDIILLYTLIGIPVTYRKRMNSQIIRIQHNMGRGSKNRMHRDITYNRVPNFLVDFDNVAVERRGVFKNSHATIGIELLNRFGGGTQETEKILMNDFAVIEVTQVIQSILDYDMTFYDIELDKNHLFVHSLGNITHNCCRLNINQKELINRPGGMWGPGDSSVSGDTPVYVNIDGNWELRQIGDIHKGRLKNFKTLSFNPLTSEIEEAPVSNCVKHGIRDTFRLKTNQGTIKITKDHCMFNVSDGGDVVNATLDDVRERGYFLAPKSHIVGSMHRLNVAEELIKNGFDGKNAMILLKDELIFNKLISSKEAMAYIERNYKKKFTDIKCNWKHSRLGRPAIAFGLFRILYKKGIIKASDLKGMSIGKTKYILPLIIDLNYDAGLILGLFLAEGCIHEACMAYNNNEKILEMCADAAKKILKNEPSVYKQVKGSRKSGSVTFNSQFVAKYLRFGLGLGGHSDTKRIPVYMQNSNPAAIKGLIDGYYLGDGHKSDEFIELTTVSKELAKGLMLSLKRIGSRFSLKEHKKAGRKRSYNVRIHSYSGKAVSIKKRYGKDIKHLLPLFIKGAEELKKGMTARKAIELGLPQPFYNLHYTPRENTVVKGFEILKRKNLMNGYFNTVLRFLENYERVDVLDVSHHGKEDVYDLSVPGYENFVAGDGMFFTHNTGSVGVVTMNVSRFAYEAKKESGSPDEAKTLFLNKLRKYMLLARDSLEIKRKVVERNMKNGLVPYTRVYLGTFRNHFSTIGLCGMNEACLNLLGGDISTPEGKALAIETLNFMRDLCLKFQRETGNLYNLEATPAESSIPPEEKVLIKHNGKTKLMKIGEMIDKKFRENQDKIEGFGKVLKKGIGDIKVFGFDHKTQRIGEFPVSALVRHRGKDVYEIRTKSGRRVKVTGDHSVFTIDPYGRPAKIKASEMEKGSFIAVPRRIDVIQKEHTFNLFDIFRNTGISKYMYLQLPNNYAHELVKRHERPIKNWLVKNERKTPFTDYKCFWNKEGILPLKMLADLKISPDIDILKGAKIFYRKTKNTAKVPVIIRLDPRLSFILGSMLAEGYLKNAEFTCGSKKYFDKFTDCVERIFGPEAIKWKGRKDYYNVIMSKTVALLFEHAFDMKGTSNTKRIPYYIYDSADRIVESFIEGLYLGDGTYYRNKGKTHAYFGFSTASRDILEGLNFLLLRLGIMTRVSETDKARINKKWAREYSIRVSGYEYLERFSGLILKKEFRRFSPKSVPRGDVIPNVGPVLRKIRENMGLSARKIPQPYFGYYGTVNRIERGDCNPTRQFLSTLIQFYDERPGEVRLSNPVDPIKTIRSCVEGGLFWDSVVEIKRAGKPRYVYDFEVSVNGREVENFLGGHGLICLHNTAYRLAKLDKEMYPDIITAGRKEPYLTNSTQLPVDYTDDPILAIEHQNDIQPLYTGGTIFHTFLGERLSSGGAAKALVRKIAENTRLPYFTITPTFSICPEHGYLRGEHFRCTHQANGKACGKPTEVFSRIVGYYRPIQSWNLGKREEFRDRLEYTEKKALAGKFRAEAA